MHAFDRGSDRIHGLAEEGKGHGGFVAIEHGEGVENVERAEDVKSLEVWEQDHGEVGGEDGGVGEVWLLWYGECRGDGRKEWYHCRDTHLVQLEVVYNC